ncbi:MAG: molybdopterin-dependent oxidoreductase, partial [Planctomycetota bacterium]
AELKLREIGTGLFGVLSPMMSCEEAYLLGTYLRGLDPDALLVLGPVPVAAQGDDVFHHSITKEETFRIQAEKVPNRRGIERVLDILGGHTATWDEFTKRSPDDFKAGVVVGGYLSDWIGPDLPGVLDKPFTVVLDILPNALTRRADVLIPSAAWCEKAGCWENFQNKLQPFEPAIAPPAGAKVDGDVFLDMLDRDGKFDAATIRTELADHDDAFNTLHTPAPDPGSTDVDEELYEFVEV